MASKPIVTVIIPVHNTEFLVERTLCSVLTQEGDFDMEILLVENGSTDNSLWKIKSLSGLYPNVDYLVSPKVGLPEARNYGIDHATGDYLVFIDSDDFIEPDMIQSLLEAKDRYKADIAYCNYILEYDDGRIVHAFADSGNSAIKDSHSCVYDIITEASTSSACVRIFDKNFFNNRRFPEGCCYEDHRCMYRWMSECRTLVHIDRPLYHYCIRATGITGTTSGSPEKLADYFNADFGRIEFVNSSHGFTPEQLKALHRHILSMLFQHFTDYLHAIAEKGIPVEESLAPELRQKFLAAARSMPMAHAGKRLTRKRLKIQYLWNRFIRRYYC